MTYRIETRRRAETTLLVFSGLLDEAAFADLDAHLAGPAAVELVLAVGVEVTAAVIARLRELTVAIHAESPFLAAWLRSAGEAKR